MISNLAPLQPAGSTNVAPVATCRWCDKPVTEYGSNIAGEPAHRLCAAEFTIGELQQQVLALTTKVNRISR
jgi:hypothetical protein